MGRPRSRTIEMPELELGPVWLSLQLATVTVLVLLVVATPLAWWLAFTRSRARRRRSRRRDAARAAADSARLLLARAARSGRIHRRTVAQHHRYHVDVLVRGPGS